MADRQASLYQLQNKSSSMQVQTTQFSQQAKHLRMESEWRKYRMYLLAAILLIWLLTFIFWQDQFLIVVGSTVVFGLLAYVIPAAYERCKGPEPPVENQALRSLE